MKKWLPIQMSRPEIALHIIKCYVQKEGSIGLDDYFREDGFVVANVNRIAQLSGRIEKVKTITDKLGRAFYELKFS